MTRRIHKPAAELMTDGWLPPAAAARTLGISLDELDRRTRRGEVQRKPVIPGASIFLYKVSG